MKIKGEWEHGEIISGTWIFPNGTFYEGIFEKNLPKSRGTWHFVNGNKVTGEYMHSQARIPYTNEIGTKLSWLSEEDIFDPNKMKTSS